MGLIIVYDIWFTVIPNNRRPPPPWLIHTQTVKESLLY